MDIRRTDLNNYLISYKGHGMIEHANSSNSIGHVVNHEQRHLAEFESRARARNQELIRKDISLSYKFIDGKIVAVAGKATAVAREITPDKNQISQPNLDSIPGGKSIETGRINNDPDKKINQLVSKIESALSTIENRIEGIPASEGGNESEVSSVNKVRLEMKKQ